MKNTTEFIESAPTKYSEEQLQNIKNWILNPITQNLAESLKEKIETDKKNWLHGAYVLMENKSLGDYNAGFCSGLNFVLDFIENGGVAQRGNSDVAK